VNPVVSVEAVVVVCTTPNPYSSIGSPGAVLFVCDVEFEELLSASRKWPTTLPGMTQRLKMPQKIELYCVLFLSVVHIDIIMPCDVHSTAAPAPIRKEQM